MKPLSVDPAADADVRDACLWYESQSPGLSLEFLRALDATLGAVGRHPDAYQAVSRSRSARRALLRRFPYFVLFIETDAVIGVVGVFHTSRDPQAWLARAADHGG